MNEPAFPCAMPTGRTNEHVDIDAREVSYIPEYKHFPGVSALDWFAAQMPGFDEGTKPNYACAMLGWQERVDFPPSWWVQADAAYRYMQAEAMMEERQKRLTK